jgi:DNA-binding PadR family transcriptional regulator
VTINPTAASVLGFLSIGPLTGWDMNALAEVSVGHFWNMTRSQIYRELSFLEDAGLVSGDDLGSRGARRFHLTAAGRRRLRAWLAAPTSDAVERNPFLVKIFFADQMAAEDLEELVRDARHRHEQTLATLEAAVEMAEQLSPLAAATARYGVAVHRANLDWFDHDPALPGGQSP